MGSVFPTSGTWGAKMTIPPSGMGTVGGTHREPEGGVCVPPSQQDRGDSRSQNEGVPLM